MADELNVQTREASETSESSEQTAARRLDDATFEPQALVEQSGDYRQAEAIQGSFVALLDNTASEAAAASDQAPASEAVLAAAIAGKEDTVAGREPQVVDGVFEKAPGGDDGGGENITPINLPKINAAPDYEPGAPGTGESGQSVAATGRDDTVAGREPQVVDGVFEKAPGGEESGGENITPINLPKIAISSMPESGAAKESAAQKSTEEAPSILNQTQAAIPQSEEGQGHKLEEAGQAAVLRQTGEVQGYKVEEADQAAVLRQAEEVQGYKIEEAGQAAVLNPADAPGIKFWNEGEAPAALGRAGERKAGVQPPPPPSGLSGQSVSPVESELLEGPATTPRSAFDLVAGGAKSGSKPSVDPMEGGAKSGSKSSVDPMAGGAKSSSKPSVDPVDGGAKSGSKPSVNPMEGGAKSGSKPSSDPVDGGAKSGSKPSSDPVAEGASARLPLDRVAERAESVARTSMDAAAASATADGSVPAALRRNSQPPPPPPANLTGQSFSPIESIKLEGAAANARLSFDPAAEGAGSAPKPLDPAAESGRSAPKPLDPAAESGRSAPKPLDPAAESGRSAPKPLDPAAESGRSAPKPLDPAAESGRSAPKPLDPAAEGAGSADRTTTAAAAAGATAGGSGQNEGTGGAGEVSTASTSDTDGKDSSTTNAGQTAETSAETTAAADTDLADSAEKNLSEGEASLEWTPPEIYVAYDSSGNPVIVDKNGDPIDSPPIVAAMTGDKGEPLYYGRYVGLDSDKLFWIPFLERDFQGCSVGMNTEGALTVFDASGEPLSVQPKLLKMSGSNGSFYTVYNVDSQGNTKPFALYDYVGSLTGVTIGKDADGHLTAFDASGEPLAAQPHITILGDNTGGEIYSVYYPSGVKGSQSTPVLLSAYSASLDGVTVAIGLDGKRIAVDENGKPLAAQPIISAITVDGVEQFIVRYSTDKPETLSTYSGSLEGVSVYRDESGKLVAVDSNGQPLAAQPVITMYTGSAGETFFAVRYPTEEALNSTPTTLFLYDAPLTGMYISVGSDGKPVAVDADGKPLAAQPTIKAFIGGDGKPVYTATYGSGKPVSLDYYLPESGGSGTSQYLWK